MSFKSSLKPLKVLKSAYVALGVQTVICTYKYELTKDNLTWLVFVISQKIFITWFIFIKLLSKCRIWFTRILCTIVLPSALTHARHVWCSARAHSNYYKQLSYDNLNFESCWNHFFIFENFEYNEMSSAIAIYCFYGNEILIMKRYLYRFL
jgi:hypothetical protein